MQKTEITPIILKTHPSSRRQKRKARYAWLTPTLSLLFAILTGTALGTAIAHQRLQCQTAQRELQLLEKQLAEEKERQEWLKHQIRWMHTSSGLETAARRMGYIRPGEIPLCIREERE